MFALALAAGVSLPQATMAQAGGAQDTRPGVAVLPFENGGSYGQAKENYEALQVGLAQTMLTELAVNPGLRVVDRQAIQKLIAEQDLGASGRVDAATAAKIGKLVGAKYMISGGFMELNGEFKIVAHMINTETSEVFNAQTVTDKREKLFSLITEITGKLARGANLPALPRQSAGAAPGAAPGGAPAARGTPSTEALTFYSRALVYADRGDKTKATELFNRAIAAFPNYTAAQEGLRQLGG
jgi:TolB-like protein